MASNGALEETVFGGNLVGGTLAGLVQPGSLGRGGEKGLNPACEKEG